MVQDAEFAFLLLSGSHRPPDMVAQSMTTCKPRGNAHHERPRQTPVSRSKILWGTSRWHHDDDMIRAIQGVMPVTPIEEHSSRRK